MPQTLLEWDKRQKIDTGVRGSVTTVETERVKDLEREVKELRRPSEGARPPTEILMNVIDEHRDVHGVEPICAVLQIAPSGYRRHAARRRDPGKRSTRAKRDAVLVPAIERFWRANLQVYGADKVWHQLGREGTGIARCTVERLLRRQGLHG